MNRLVHKRPAVLMIAYTNYHSDPRVIREAEAALSGGFDVDFLALKRVGEPASEMVRGIRVVHLNQHRYRGRGHWNYLLAYFEFFVRCLFKSTALGVSRRYRVVHVNNMPDFMVFSTIFLKLLGAKIILDIHDPMPDTFASKFRSGDKGLFYRLLLLQERLSAWYSNSVITVHEPVKEFVLARHGLPLKSIGVIANFADGDLFKVQPYSPFCEKVRMVFHGTILERYGLRNLLLALSKVANPDRLSVTVIGEGDFSSEFHRLIQSFGLEHVVHFDNHSYPVHQIPTLLKEFHLGLVPLEISAITNYALPLKLLEYVSLGLPVITVRSVAISYYFAEADCLFFDSDDVSSLTRLLDRVVENPDLLLTYRHRSLQIRDKFLWTTEKSKYIALLCSLSGIKQAALPTPAPEPQVLLEERM